ncbi:DUF4398 domain-containing protein [Halobacteriovorax sp. GFR7]|uniref:DUF4398 domain-containing protein n=1 Tax=Bacteriovoracales TaxID=2024979 RepID=UPI000590388D|nr:DUF4398 domain-containing protein [Bacteriovorax sp. BAL6_X]
MKKLKNKITFLILLLSLGSCGLTTVRPKLEMTYAQVAFLAAKEAGGQTLAPNLYRKAEFYYLKAKSSYKRKFFNKAKKYAILSKQFSEKAEFKAYRKKTLDSI